MNNELITDIQALAKKIKNNFSLCDFLGKLEKEIMVAQTVHAAVLNHKEHGEAFSIRGAGVFTSSNGGLVDNGGAYASLLKDELFREEKRVIEGEEKTVIFPTQKLIDKLKVYFEQKGVKA